jgi:hypothetical protein
VLNPRSEEEGRLWYLPAFAPMVKILHWLQRLMRWSHNVAGRNMLLEPLY